MRRKRMRLFSLILSAVCLLGYAATAAQSPALPEPDTRVPIQAETQTAKDDTESGTTTVSLLPAADGKAAEKSKITGVEETPKPTKDAETSSGKTEETPSAPTGESQPTVPEQPTTPEQPVTPAPQPEPAPTEPEPVPAAVQEPEPAPAPEPAASGNIYSIAEAVRAGNEYARAQYGVTIDTSMTTADSSYFPGTADSVAWLAENGGQAALTAAVKGNVDATFACLAAMDGAETVSAYARFNCTARYDAASDEYIVVVLYG